MGRLSFLHSCQSTNSSFTPKWWRVKNVLSSAILYPWICFSCRCLFPWKLSLCRDMSVSQGHHITRAFTGRLIHNSLLQVPNDLVSLCCNPVCPSMGQLPTSLSSDRQTVELYSDHPLLVCRHDCRNICWSGIQSLTRSLRSAHIDIHLLTSCVKYCYDWQTCSRLNHIIN